jgi:3-hydroxybutyryl-CoA dehydratase
MNEYRWEDIHPGLKASFEASFTPEQMRQFAEISGDWNPLHTEAGYADDRGYSGSIVFGMLSSSLYSRLVGMYLPGKYCLLQGIDLDFNNPCFAGELLSVEGEVSFLNEAYRRFEVRGRIRKVADRSTVSRATIRLGFHE